MPTLKLAAAYTRVSTDDQVEFSLDAQIKAIRDYAAKNGYTIHPEHIYIDDGYSGRRAEKRPAFMRMVAAAKQKPTPFEAIFVHKLDRFARSREDSVVYKSLLRKDCGVKVVSITETMEDDKFSIILEAMLEAMAEYYSINLSEEVKKGMTEKALRGGLQSNPPFGYTVENNTLIPVEREAVLIRDIFNRFLSGEGYFPIAKWLNDIGVTTHRGRRFEHRTIEYIIRNPAYIGKLRWNPAGRTRRDFDNENIILADSGHQPLIDIPTWEKAQQRVAEIKAKWRYHSRPVTELRDWISGVVRCAACGKTMVFVKPHFWKCNGFAHGSCRVSQHVRDDELKRALIARLTVDMTATRDIRYVLTPLSKSGVNEAEALEAKKQRLCSSIQRLREAYLSGVESLADYTASKRRIEDEISAIKSKLAALQPEGNKENIQKAVQSSIADVLSILQSSTADLAAKHEAVSGIIHQCTYDKAQNLLAVWYRYSF